MTRLLLSETTKITEQLAAVLAEEPAVAAAYLFGSVARGEANVDSDVDVGVVFRRGVVDRDRVMTSLAAEIGRALGIDVVDVVDLEAQGPIFCHEVLCDGSRIYEADTERRIDFESDTIVRALDFRPTYELATRGKARAMRRWLEERYDLRADSVEAGHPQGKSPTA